MERYSLFQAVREAAAATFGSRLVGVTVFGSYARGDASADSDLDILVVADVPADERVDWAARLRVVLDLPVPVDILVRRPEDVAARLAIGDDFLAAVINGGVSLVEAAR